jgi:hypothetical protein
MFLTGKGGRHVRLITCKKCSEECSKKNGVFWDVTPCGSVHPKRRFLHSINWLDSVTET